MAVSRHVKGNAEHSLFMLIDKGTKRCQVALAGPFDKSLVAQAVAPGVKG